MPVPRGCPPRPAAAAGLQESLLSSTGQAVRAAEAEPEKSPKLLGEGRKIVSKFQMLNSELFTLLGFGFSLCRLRLCPGSSLVKEEIFK